MDGSFKVILRPGSYQIDRAGSGVSPDSITLKDSGLDEKAVEAVRQWQFQAGLKDGKPVEGAMLIEVLFRL